MQVSKSAANAGFSANPELFIAETGDWIAENWLRIAIAVGIAAAIVLVLLTVQKLAQRLCREGEALVGWRTIAGRLAARTKFWFLVILAAKIVDNYAAAPLWLDRTITFLFTVGMTVQAAIWARELVLGVVEHRAGDAQHGNGALTSAMSIIRALVTFLIFAIALVLILGNLGVNVAGLVAGLGIGGIAIGLAAQGIFSDLFAGVSILFDRPFKVGDNISWGDASGTVEQIGMRTTRVRLFTGELLIVSNKNLLDKEIRNVTVRRHIRLSFMLGVTYETRPETLARIPAMLTEMGEAQGATVARAGFEAFGASSLDFSFIVDVPGADWGVAHPTRDRLLVAIMERFAAEGVSLAYPTQTSYTAAPDGTLIMPYAELPADLLRVPAAAGTSGG
ncbi:MAG: mechanosensitive ion channel protein MscS [Novosphingobium sp. 28-62-57]|uniref:mechanosensitive ion channel family protein n=1 Tax=Novosphingobium sp. 28-62-57 TaxID=1970409 RepID=UPI000BC7B872|nr:mechanosensitive ion channel family protein [Novosphingobium sp. 28-62-57]OYW48234.1 MAG: mechanosensitive ion channel protein MscS [Novosphingobium sp. 12-62-10]OYZ10281.1 MAG: mechanosensitive ion channel protein MscS [Novosphingobium sp. 28-62-57]OYZ97259.1 MAG: mechanosensitive ion channel protein MscS [Novosphingobium sp. 17-62-8]HQS71287.1 mechanosensitive ion channel family protein [Novosphingobium sp.]